MQKYEREIAELLEKLESEDQRSHKHFRRDRPPQLPRRRSSLTSLLRRLGRALRLSPMHFLVGGLALVVISWLIPYHAVSRWVFVVGVLVFLWPIISSLLNISRPGRGDEKLWRGRRIDEPDEAPWSELRNRVEHAVHDFQRRFRRRY